METGEIRKAVEPLKNELVELRRDFHMHPELGFQEHRTAEKVETYLRNLGLEPKRIGGTGVTALIRGTAERGIPEDGDREPVLLLRADMDALPMQEENEVPYASQNKGVMHACGHDAHTAMLLVAAKVLNRFRDRFSGTVKLVFQPNEEIAGAKVLIEEGLMTHPDVNAALGIHIWTPLKSGTIGIQAGGVMASLDVFKIVVRGRGGHTGYPESAVDPLLAASSIVLESQRIQTREISLMKPTVIVFGKITGGTKYNIIPEEVILEGTMRYLYPGDPESEENPAGRLRRVAEAVCDLHGCSCEVQVERENTAVVNDPGMVDLVREAAAQVLGSPDAVVPHASMAGEDFSVYASMVPAAFIFLGTSNPEKGSDYPHHNPRFNIDEDTLPAGVELFVQSALSWFNRQGPKEV